MLTFQLWNNHPTLFDIFSTSPFLSLYSAWYLCLFVHPTLLDHPILYDLPNLVDAQHPMLFVYPMFFRCLNIQHPTLFNYWTLFMDSTQIDDGWCNTTPFSIPLSLFDYPIVSTKKKRIDKSVKHQYEAPNCPNYILKFNYLGFHIPEIFYSNAQNIVKCMTSILSEKSFTFCVMLPRLEANILFLSRGILVV